jgi:transposase
LIAAIIHSAGEQDRDGAKELLTQLLDKHERLENILSSSYRLGKRLRRLSPSAPTLCRLTGGLLASLTFSSYSLKTILADGAYAGKLQQWFHRKTCGKKRLTITKRSDKKGFHVIPKRWIVERTFGWMNWLRRLSKDYEHNPKTSLSLLFIADAFTITKKLCAT